MLKDHLVGFALGSMIGIAVGAESAYMHHRVSNLEERLTSSLVQVQKWGETVERRLAPATGVKSTPEPPEPAKK